MTRLAARSLSILSWAVLVASPAAAQISTPEALSSAAPATPSPYVVTGAWVGAFDLGGVRRRVAMVLRERARGDVFGYVLGGNGWWTITDGSLRGNRLELTLVVTPEDGQTTSLAISGIVGVSTFTGTSDDGSGPQALTLRRRKDVLHARRLFFADVVGGNPVSVVTLAVVHDDAGRLVAGGFEGAQDCDLLGCLGKVTSFSEVGNNLTISVRSGDPCPGTATLTASFDPLSLFYSGTWTRNDCNGSAAGVLLGARGTRTRSDDVLEILDRLDELADCFEASVPFGSSHPAVSSSYLNFGRLEADLLGGFDKELAAYTGIRAEFHSIYQIATVADPTTLPDFDVGELVTFEELRSGIPVAGGAREQYIDTRVRPTQPLLRNWANEGEWVIKGNQLPGFDLPFDYTVGASALEIPTPGGTVYASFGSWGAHFGPMTGHPNGDAKGNGIGFLTQDESDMTELVGNGNGTYELGETWGYWGGLTGDLVRNKTPVYKAVWDGTVVALQYNGAPSGFYFDDPPHWELFIDFENTLELRLGHLGSIADPLRLQILALTGIDTSTYVGAPGDEILGGIEIPVSTGDELCYPQMIADPVPGFPGYFKDKSPTLGPPWAQMEWSMLGPVGMDRADVCHYDLMGPAAGAALQGMIDVEVVDPLSQRYRFIWNEKWLWGAEGRACMAYTNEPQDFSSLYTQLGGWFEIDGPATTTDELVSFVPMATETAAFEPALYDPANVGWLLVRQRAFPTSLTWLMPDGSNLMVAYPRAEVLDLQGDQLLLKWRDLGYKPGGGPETPVYQRAAYVLDGNGLKVKWGVLANTPAGALLPVLLPTDPCNDVDVICYDHTHQLGF